MDYLKQIRLHHHLLLITCLSGLALSVIPQSVGDQRTAYLELTALEILNSSDLNTMTAVHLQKVIFPDDEPAPDLIVSVSPRPEFDSRKAVRGVFGDGDVIGRALRIVYGGDLSIDDATLAQVAMAFGVYFLAPAPTADEQKRLRACALSAPDEALIVTVSQSTIRDDLAFRGELPEKESADSLPSNAVAHIGDAECGDVTLSYESLRGIVPGAFEGLFSDGSPLSGIARIVALEPSPTSMQGLAAFSTWAIVEDLTISEAKRELRRRLEATGASETVLGLPLNRVLAVALLPFAILALQVLLTLHLQAALSHVGSDDLRQFAWIGLYTDVLAVPLTIASLTMLPAFTVYRLFDSMSFDSSSTGLVSIAAASILLGAVASVLAIALVRRSRWSPPAVRSRFRRRGPGSQ